MDDLKNILNSLGIYNDDLDSFLEGKIKSLPCEEDEFDWGCFPVIKDNILIDIRLLVPNITNLKTLLINIHEFAHAFELYGMLNMPYIEDTGKRELFAQKKEKEYLNIKK